MERLGSGTEMFNATSDCVMIGKDDQPDSREKSEHQNDQKASQLWGWFWVVIATAALYLLVWVTR